VLDPRWVYAEDDRRNARVVIDAAKPWIAPRYFRRGAQLGRLIKEFAPSSRSSCSRLMDPSMKATSL